MKDIKIATDVAEGIIAYPCNVDPDGDLMLLAVHFVRGLRREAKLLTLLEKLGWSIERIVTEGSKL